MTDLLSTRFATSSAAPVARSYRAATQVALWSYHLCFCLPLVFLIGAPALVVTRLVFKLHFPEEFIGTLPSISGTASAPPSSEIFEWTMIAAALCIIVAWSVNLAMNMRRLAEATRPGRDLGVLAAVNLGAWGSGVLAAFFLGLLGAVNLTDGHDVHMLASEAFYTCQVVSFLLDCWCALWLRRVCSGLDGRAEMIAVCGKLTLAAAVLVSSLFFLYMFLTKDLVSLDDRFFAQEIYVATEYAVAMLSFAYPVAAFGELRRHYRRLARVTPRALAAAR